MEPTTIGTYDEVAWFRKQWFVWVLVLFFWPPLIILAATGDLYAKANRKMKQHSDAVVWRYSGAGKTMIFAAGIIFSLLAVIQVVTALAAREDSPRRSEVTATEPASVDDSGSGGSTDADSNETPSSAAPTTNATASSTTATSTATTTTTIVAGPAAILYEEILTLAEADVDNADITAWPQSIVDEFPPIPVAGDAALVTSIVGAEVGRGRREGEVKFNVFSVYSTPLSVDDVVALYRVEAPPVDLPEREFETGSDDDGMFVDVEFGDFGSHPDPTIDWAVLNVRVRATDEGTEVRLAHTVNRLIAEIPTGSILGRLGEVTPLLADHELVQAEVTLFYLNRVSVTTHVRVVAPRVVTDPADELQQIATKYDETGEWLTTEIEPERANYEMPLNADVRASTHIGFISDEVTNISHRLTLK